MAHRVNGIPPPDGPAAAGIFSVTSGTAGVIVSRPMRRLIAPLLLACSLAAASCVTYAEELNRGQRHFQANEYERALAIWRILETDIDSLSTTDRTRYAYLRGMTD